MGQLITHEAFNGEPFPEGLVAPNITPDKETGAGTWTDAQLERAIRHGIGHDDRELNNYMPYPFFRSMTDEDVASVIVYLRSLPAVKNPQHLLAVYSQESRILKFSRALIQAQRDLVELRLRDGGWL